MLLRVRQGIGHDISADLLFHTRMCTWPGKVIDCLRTCLAWRRSNDVGSRCDHTIALRECGQPRG